MPNTSATGGYLAPSSTSVAFDEAFDREVSQLVRGITGLPSGMVRPRWQAIPPKQPDVTADWCACGIVDIRPDFGTVTIHHPEGLGSDEIQRHETVELLLSFYGPNAYGYASLMRDGVQVAQNREALRAAGMALLEAGRILSAPDLVNGQWVKRADLTLAVRREIDRVFPVLNIISAAGTIQQDYPATQSFTVTES